MRILEALKILEDAVLDSRERPIDSPAACEALDLLERFVWPKYAIKHLRAGLIPPNRREYYLEIQQHDLNHWFRLIHRSVRSLLARRVTKLGDHFAKTNDQKIKAEFERLSAELDRLPQKWAFMPRSGRH